MLTIGTTTGSTTTDDRDTFEAITVPNPTEPTPAEPDPIVIPPDGPRPGDFAYAWCLLGADPDGGLVVVNGFVSAPDQAAARERVYEFFLTADGRGHRPATLHAFRLFELPTAFMASAVRAAGYGVMPGLGAELDRFRAELADRSAELRAMIVPDAEARRRDEDDEDRNDADWWRRGEPPPI